METEQGTVHPAGRTPLRSLASFAVGHRGWVILGWVLLVALAVITNIGLEIPFLFTGSLLLESLFGIPGLGAITVDAINGNDFSTLRTMVYIGSLLFVGGQILTDLSYGLVDPRVRFD